MNFLDAKKLYATGQKDLVEMALRYFSEDQMTLPASLDEIKIHFPLYSVAKDMSLIEYDQSDFEVNEEQWPSTTFFSSSRLALSAAALSQLSFLVKTMNDGAEWDGLRWSDDFGIDGVWIVKPKITCFVDEWGIEFNKYEKPLFGFKSQDSAKFSLVHHRGLWEQYFGITPSSSNKNP